MFTGLQKRIKAEELFQLQAVQWEEMLLMEDTVAAGSRTLAKIAVGNAGHFLLQRITGSFTTLYDTGGAVVGDDGVSHLRGQLSAGGNRLPIFSDFIPLNLFLTPGREKSALVPAGAAAGNLFYPIHLEYLFPANGDILLDVKNDSDWLNSFRICFHGIRIAAAASTYGV